MYCPTCGTELGDGVNFCPKCGTKRPQPKSIDENSVDQPKPSVSDVDTSAPDAQHESQPADAACSHKATTSVKKKSKLPLIIGILGVIIVAFIVIVALFGNQGPPEISTVKNGYLGEYTDMSVAQVLDGYYRSGLGYEAGTWDCGVTDDGTTIVQVEYTHETLDSVTIQFFMLDENCFKITAFIDPTETIEEPSDLLAALNKIYITSYELQYSQEEMSDIESQLLERLASVNATSVRYGASKNYEGDRSQLYKLFGDTPLEMSVVALLDIYGYVDLSTLSRVDTDSSANNASTAVFSSGTFATKSDASSVYENGGIVVDLTVLNNQVTYTVTSISSAQRIATLSGVADQGNTIHATGDDGWGNIVKGDIIAVDDNFISVEFELVSSNAGAAWELDCPYTILTRCVETDTTASFDITNSENDPTSFTDAEFSMMPALDESIILLNDEHGNASSYLAPYVNSWVNVFNISPSELLDSNSIIIGTGGMVYGFIDQSEYSDAVARYMVSNDSTTSVVGYLIQASNTENSMADYQLINCVTVNGIVGSPI